MPIFLFMTSPLLYQISSNISENRYTINSMHLGWRKFPSPNSDLHSILPMTYAALWGSLNRERGREWFLILKKMKVLEMVIKFIGNEDKFREMLQWKHESSQLSTMMMKERREEGRKKTGRVKKRKEKIAGCGKDILGLGRPMNQSGIKTFPKWSCHSLFPMGYCSSSNIETNPKGGQVYRRTRPLFPQFVLYSQELICK